MTRKTLDVAGAETTETADITKYVFTIELARRLDGMSSSKMSIAKVKTKAVITLNMPDSGIAGTNVSGKPIAGKFILSCTDPINGQKLSTGEMGFNTSDIWIKEGITAAIPFLADNVDVFHSYKYPYYENGREFFIIFRDVHSNPAQCTMESGTETPLTGAETADATPVPTL